MADSSPAETDLQSFVRQIHAGSLQWVLSFTGGGSGAISSLLGVPGASRSVLEAVVPYASEALGAWLGRTPEQACSPHTAAAMAMAAFQRAKKLVADRSRAPDVAGLGCTASLATDRPKHGEHRIHVGVQMKSLTLVHSLVLAKGRRTRAGEEQVAQTLVLNTLAEAGGIAQRLPLALLSGEEVASSQCCAPQEWQDLLAGTQTAVCIPPRKSSTAPRVIFPGAFNPLHDGHRRMAQIAAGRLKAPVDFEISVVNVDKPPLDFLEMDERASQFADTSPLWFTRAPTFVEKAALFPGCWFVVGADTISRIAEARYYDDDPQAMQRAFAALAAHGCRFLVFGRATPAGFQTLSQLKLPPELAVLCEEVPADDFRQDISSTALRQTHGSE